MLLFQDQISFLIDAQCRKGTQVSLQSETSFRFVVRLGQLLALLLMNIAMLRSNPVCPDPRIEKEADALLSFGHRVTIICWDRSKRLPAKEETKLVNGSVKFLRGGLKSEYGNGLRNLLPLLCFQIFLLWQLYLARKDLDAIHAADLDTAIPAWIIAKLYKKLFVYDIYDYYIDAFSVPALIKPLVGTIDTFIINQADAVVLTTEKRVSQIRNATPKRLLIIHNTPQHVCARPKRNVSSKPSVAYVGILSRGRLLLEILDVFARRKDWTITIGGFGELSATIAKLGNLHPNIKYIGTVNYADAIQISSEADVLFATYDPSVPNHKYCSPNKVYEAMMLSKPIIVCAGTGVDELVDSIGMGLAIPYNAIDFDIAVGNLLRNPDLRVRMGRQGRQAYDREYSWEIMSQRLISLYNHLADTTVS